MGSQDGSSAERDRGATPDPGDEQHKGVCVRWDEDGGFGFLAREGQKDMFVHRSGLGPVDDLRVGDEVAFTIKEGRKGQCAELVELLRRDVEIRAGKLGRRPGRGANVYDKWDGNLIKWNGERGIGIIRARDGTTVLLREQELGGADIAVGDTCYFE
eukprot:gene19418-biopygen38142